MTKSKLTTSKPLIDEIDALIGSVGQFNLEVSQARCKEAVDRVMESAAPTFYGFEYGLDTENIREELGIEKPRWTIPVGPEDDERHEGLCDCYDFDTYIHKQTLGFLTSPWNNLWHNVDYLINTPEEEFPLWLSETLRELCLQQFGAARGDVTYRFESLDSREYPDSLIPQPDTEDAHYPRRRYISTYDPRMQQAHLERFLEQGEQYEP